jgi:hypothetical protein
VGIVEALVALVKAGEVLFSMIPDLVDGRELIYNFPGLQNRNQ